MHVALIRGINVGGHKTIAMADLRRLFESLKFTHVKSLLQSGNVVFDGNGRPSAQIEQLLEAELVKRLRVEADFFVRSAKEWDAIVAGNPFRKEADADPGRLVVMCLKDAASAAAVTALQKAIKGRELVRATGKQLYIVFPDGIGRSALTNALIERTLGTRGTARNWNTVLKVQVLMTGGGVE